MVGAAALTLVGLSGPAGSATTATPAADDSVTYQLTGSPGDLRPRAFTVDLRCGGQPTARATLVEGRNETQTRPHHVVGQTCTATAATTVRRPLYADEVTFTVRQGDEVRARRTLYARDGRQAVSTDFVVPGGDLRVDVRVQPVRTGQIGTPLRMMAFNIWRSGVLDNLAGEAAGRENLRQLIEFVRSVDPDVLFMVETYGSGPAITDGLNAGLPADRRYTGVQITREADTVPGTDNLWLFTRLPVEKVYPPLQDGDLTSFNFGGARLGLPNGEHIHAFSTWLHHTDGAWNLTNQSALESTLGLSRTYADAQVLATDQRRRIGMATTLLRERLQTYVGDDDGPVFLGGDFNTLSNLDWTSQFANAPGHGGLTLEWPATKLFDDAGFVDTYRWASPDAGRFPGRTWSPYAGFGYAPGRIDYIFARGTDVRVLASHTHTRRLEQHQSSELNDIFPFYSDHGAVVSDVLIRGAGTGPDPDAVPVYDEPDAQPSQWPAPPAGRAVPPAELSATATSQNTGGEASRAVDGDLRTHWHSQYQPVITPLPHEITIDLGRVRNLSALRYQPRIVGNLNGTILRATIQASQDGTTFQDVARVEWERTTLPKDVNLQGMAARYVRVHVDLGIGGFSSAAEITPYEVTP